MADSQNMLSDEGITHLHTEIGRLFHLNMEKDRLLRESQEREQRMSALLDEVHRRYAPPDDAPTPLAVVGEVEEG